MTSNDLVTSAGADLDPYRVGRMQAWSRLERKFSSDLIQITGAAFAFVIALVFVPLPISVTIACGFGLWLGVALIGYTAGSLDECRQWREYHATLAANPLMWPWPPMPSET